MSRIHDTDRGWIRKSLLQCSDIGIHQRSGPAVIYSRQLRCPLRIVVIKRKHRILLHAQQLNSWAPASTLPCSFGFQNRDLILKHLQKERWLLQCLISKTSCNAFCTQNWQNVSLQANEAHFKIQNRIGLSFRRKITHIRVTGVEQESLIDKLICTSLRRGPLILSKSPPTAVDITHRISLWARTTPRLERCADLRHADFTAIVEVSVLSMLEKFWKDYNYKRNLNCGKIEIAEK